MTAADLIQIMTDRIVQDFHPLRLILFGSQACGYASPESNIDLLVVLPQVANKRLAAVEIRRALADLPVCKDIVVTTPEEITRRGDLIGTVLRLALREGKVLFMNEAEHLVATRRWLRPVQGRSSSREAA